MNELYRWLVIFTAEYLIFVIFLLGLVNFAFLENSKKKQFLIFALLAFVIALVGNKILETFYNNPRPFVTDGVKPLIPHGTDNGFPSGHTLWSALVAAVTTFFNRRLGLVLCVLAVLVGWGRVLANVHHVVDIIGALGLAVGSAYLSRLTIKKFSRKLPFIR